MPIAHHHDYHHARQESSTSNPTPTLTADCNVAINNNATVVIVCPTASVVITSADSNAATNANSGTAQTNLDRTVIIVLSALCFALVCIIAVMLVWFRRGIIRRLNGVKRSRGTDGDDDIGLEVRTTGGTSVAPLVPGGASDGGMTTGRMSKESRRKTATATPDTVHQRQPRSLVIDSHLAMFSASSSLKDGGSEPRTTSWLDSFEHQRPSDEQFRPTQRTLRAVSYPSDSGVQYFPRTPDSAFPLTQFSGDSSSTLQLLPPPPSEVSPGFNPLNSTIQQHRRLHTVHEVDSIRSLPLHSPSALDVDRDPSPRLTVPGRASTEYHTPLGSTPEPELPPSPPPSPTTTITSPSPARRSSDASASLSSGGQPRNGGSSQSSGQRPQTAVSVLSMSSTSGSSTRFSSLFFAPMASTPPQQNPIAEAAHGPLSP